MDRDKFDQMMKESLGPMGTSEELAELIEPKNAQMTIGFDVIDVQRVNLQPGDVLMITVKNDELTQESVDGLRKHLQTLFPDNKVFVFAMGTSDDVQISVVSQPAPKAVDCSDPVAYCSNCNCGKKEAINGQST